MDILQFPAAALGLQVNATTTASTAVNLPSKGGSVRVVNEGTVAAFVAISADGSNAVLPGAGALRTSATILPGTDSVFRIDSSVWLQISAITRSGTTTLQVYVSEGQ